MDNVFRELHYYWTNPNLMWEAAAYISPLLVFLTIKFVRSR